MHQTEPASARGNAKAPSACRSEGSRKDIRHAFPSSRLDFHQDKIWYLWKGDFWLCSSPSERARLGGNLAGVDEARSDGCYSHKQEQRPNTYREGILCGKKRGHRIEIGHDTTDLVRRSLEQPACTNKIYRMTLRSTDHLPETSELTSAAKKLPKVVDENL